MPATDVDRQLQRSTELLRRVSRRHIGRRARSATQRVKRAVQYAVFGITAIIVIALGWAILLPIGIGGVGIILLAILVALYLSVRLREQAPVRAGALGTLDIAALPSATERWLDAQRADLPAIALPMLDRIGHQLEALSPQLQRLDPSETAARELHTLLSEHLPKLIIAYRTIPKDLRRTDHLNQSPERQLAEGLAIIDAEIRDRGENLARCDLDGLAVHGRYLEIKYREMKEIARP
jgi:hypothetical protein